MIVERFSRFIQKFSTLFPFYCFYAFRAYVQVVLSSYETDILDVRLIVFLFTLSHKSRRLYQLFNHSHKPSQIVAMRDDMA